MVLEYAFTYLPCQTCTAKIHCEQCQAEIAQALLAVDGVASAEVSIPLRQLLIHADDADPDEIDDAMDAIGVFLS